MFNLNSSSNRYFHIRKRHTQAQAVASWPGSRGGVFVSPKFRAVGKFLWSKNIRPNMHNLKLNPTTGKR